MVSWAASTRNIPNGRKTISGMSELMKSNLKTVMDFLVRCQKYLRHGKRKKDPGTKNYGRTYSLKTEGSFKFGVDIDP